MNLRSGKHYYALLFAVYALALAICGAARVLLKLRFMELDTGFYTHDTGIATVLNMGLLVAVLVLFIANRLRTVESDYSVHYKGRVSGALCVLTGLSIAAYTLLEEQIYPQIEQNYAPAMLQARDIVCLVLGVAAGLSMIWVGVGVIRDRTSSAAAIPAILPCIWQVYMLITRFNGFTVLTTISDNLLAVLFMVFSTLFLIGQSRTIFGLTRKDGRNYTIPAGLCASLFGLLLVVPNYLYMLFERTPAIPAPMLGPWESVYVLALSVYAIVFVIGMTRSIKHV